jgi:phage FluMu gp28-like protein
LFPVISAGHAIRVVSTPNGKLNKFYELMTSESGVWSKHQTTIYEACKQGLDRDWRELKEALNDEDAWAQEFELQWMDEQTSWLSFELIGSCQNPMAGKPEYFNHGLTYIGVDIARRKNLWVAIVLEKVGEVLWHRETVILRNQTFAAQTEVMESLMNIYRPHRVALDQGGMGEVIVENWQSLFGGKSRIEGVLFTLKSKQALATGIKNRFQKGEICISENLELKQDLHGVQRIATLAGNVRFDAVNSEVHGHGDRFWAMALAIYAHDGKGMTKPVQGSTTYSAW